MPQWAGHENEKRQHNGDVLLMPDKQVAAD
jgi:hypothetical protein